MFLEDKITKGGEITDEGKFTLDGESFYLYLVPRSSTSPSDVVVRCKVCFNTSEIEFPFAVGYWNPTLLDSVTISSNETEKYRIFWGIEYNG